MIKLENVTKFYNSKGIITHALKNINLELYKNEFVAICGPSGSGKSTLLNVICKQDTFDEGEIYYKGNETAYFNVDDMDDFRKNKVGFIFQNYNIIESYTVLQNVMLPYELKGIPAKEAKKRALAIIDEVGLHDKINNRGAELSGGQKQRCVIARALAFEPEILACDEPTGNLDSETGAEIMALIAKIAHDKLVLVVTHNYEEVEPYATRKLTIVDGTLYEDKILREVPCDDEKEVLNLDYVPIPKKINFKVALRNLINTPKKTIFSSLVIFFACFFMLSLYQYIRYSYDYQINYYNDFAYKSKDKVVIGPKNKALTEDDIAQIAGNRPYVVNSVLDVKNFTGNFDMNKYYLNVYFETYYTDYNPSVGRKPENDTEAYLLVGDAEALNDYKPYLNREWTSSSINKSFKIVGIEKTDKVKTNVLCIDSKVYNDILKLEYNYEIDCVHQSGNDVEYINRQINMVLASGDRNILHMPKLLNNEISSVKIEGYRSVISNNDLVISVDVDNIVYDLKSGEDFYIEVAHVKNNEIKQVSIYNANSSVLNKAKNLGYFAINTKEYDATSDLNHFLNNLQAYGMMILFSIAIIIIYFISYLVMIHIYKTKAYDFNIFRTLGVTKRDMRYITIFELLIQTVIISIFTYLLTLILGAFAKENSPLIIYSSINFGTSLIYFLIIFLFGYLIARRFNKKLFKFSVAKTFKEVA